MVQAERLISAIRSDDVGAFSNALHLVDLSEVSRRGRLCSFCIRCKAFRCAEFLLTIMVCDLEQRIRGETLLTLTCGLPAPPVDFVRLLIRLGASISACDATGRPLLLVAVSNEMIDFALVAELLQYGASPNAESPNGESALSFAVVWEVLELLDLLIEFGADVNASSGGMTPLMDAVQFGRNPELVRKLIAAGADIRAMSNGRSVLEAALCCGSEEQCLLVIENGGVIPEWSQYGDKLIFMARRRNYLRVEKSLQLCFGTDL